MGRKKKEQYLILPDGQHRLFIPMSDILDIFYDERVVINGTNDKPYIIIFNNKTIWVAPLSDKTVKRFKKFKGMV